MKRRFSRTKKIWLEALHKNLDTLPDKYKFFVKRINLEKERWINLDKKDS